MAGPTFILSICELVDGALGTQDSIGTAAHTVGPIPKMGTLGTGIRALSGREKVRKMRSQGQFHTSSRTKPAIQDPPSINTSIIWPGFPVVWPCGSLNPPVLPLPCLNNPKILVLLLYRAIACGSALHGLALRVAGKAFSFMGKLTRLPAVGQGE